MSYLVLARKYRPKTFSEMVGQEHVVQALSNALIQRRLHHAYLFTGTRGVGKTTVSRILAKSLNCQGEDGQGGITATPCGVCQACRDIDAGRFVDYTELDAASNRGVDEVQGLLEQAVYKPVQGRFKVFMIDEVHMLTNTAFNAMLKTLEEPPEYLKFVLATTDPQKVPVTVLSRCLQFNLKRLDEDQIQGQMTRILAAEEIEADGSAIVQLAKAADGSLRDGLSLLDQAIAYAGGALRDDVVRTMLGTVDRTQVGAMLDALADADGQRLLQVVAGLAEFSPDWGGVLEALAEALHRIQVRQLVPGAAMPALDGLDPAPLAERLRPEIVQLWYQMALNGRRDLYLAPSPRAGFEMALLRMLAFRPMGATALPAGTTTGAATPTQGHGNSTAAAAVNAPAAATAAPASVPVAAPAAPAVAAPAPVPAAPVAAAPSAAAAPLDPPWDPPAPPAARPAPSAPVATPAPAVVPAAATAAAAEPEMAMVPPLAPPRTHAAVSDTPRALHSAEDWLELVADCGLSGPSRQLAANAAFVSHAEGVLRLSLSPGFEYLQSERSLGELAAALADALGQRPKIVIESGIAVDAETLHERSHRQRGERQNAAETAFMNDPAVQ
ncbi:DNA polymerase III subunit gamma/tau, partial [uncultured Xanthomonas sp.]|uniref:DNA polymerase III subunit gamma/tau n=1 Tax=uncultured Xanthomonas sp. TaxID=152831 RepID=UPI0025FFC08D